MDANVVLSLVALVSLLSTAAVAVAATVALGQVSRRVSGLAETFADALVTPPHDQVSRIEASAPARRVSSPSVVSPVADDSTVGVSVPMRGAGGGDPEGWS